MAIESVAETGSTNADVRVRAAKGAAEGLWLRADRQSGGKGRLGRAWESPVGNLYASTLVRLRGGDPLAPSLALLAAVALEEVAAAFARAPLRIKWPNDLLIETGSRGWAKAAGILLERAEDAVVIGFGVNLAHAPDLPERPAACLSSAGGVDPQAFCEHLAEAFARWLAIWRGQGVDPVRARWLARAHPVGTPLVARLADGASIEGLFAGLDETGALLLRTAERVVTISAGDVFLL